ncbi:hypothetical protein OS493_024166 [Desmophyllum pertusum]|uniref:Homeobox domain-containing protein n=1 Tax=Desmophyllum pertusum TaxID=174260 RepID=A0A9W9ZCQ0_9CNID|nr:hypothetical protein OS493_024166 [Desmophyllum pertusum]
MLQVYHRQQSSFETWPCIQAPVYRCCAVRYRPIFVQFLPSLHRIGAGLHRVNSEKQQLLPEQPKNVEEDDCMSCEDHELPEGNDKIKDKNAKLESKTEQCLKVKAYQRKRRNRSHFTQRQLQYLDKIFSRQQYLTRDERTLLARGLEMTELQIRNWFQNRRYQKKHCAIKNTKQDNPVSSA